MLSSSLPDGQTIPDSLLRTHFTNAQDKVVIITGGANGLGRQAGKEFARAGAKIVIGDLDMTAAASAIEEFKSLGGDAIAQKTDVTNWDHQVSLFALAVSTYGRIDTVIANAGVTELTRFDNLADAWHAEPAKPNVKTLEVNTTGVVYIEAITGLVGARLAIYHFRKSEAPNKTLILIGSLAGISGIPLAPYYTFSKHAVTGLTRSLASSAPSDLRVCMVNPWFADTAILDSGIRQILRGMPMTPVPRVGAAIFHAATNPSYADVNGSAYLIPDGGEVWRVPRLTLDNTGTGEIMYAKLRDRIVDQDLNPKGVTVEL